MIDLWLSELWSKNTRALYKREIKAFASFIAASGVANIDAFLALDYQSANTLVEAWRRSRTAYGHSDASTNAGLSAIKSFIASARSRSATKLYIDIKTKAEPTLFCCTNTGMALL